MAGRVLIVEDDLDIRDALVSILELEGFEVKAATQGEEGLAALPIFRPGLILLDLNMPKMSGLEFLELLPHDAPPVLVMTAKLGEKPAKARALIRKPLDVDHLLQEIIANIRA